MQHFGLTRTYRDFDALSGDANAWDLHLLPREAGDFQGHLKLGRLGPVQIAEARFGRGLLQMGAPPRGHRTFGVPTATCSPFLWRGHSVDTGCLLVFPEGGELHAASRPGFYVVTISIEESHLARVARAHGFPGLTRLLDGAELVACPRESFRLLRRELAHLSAALASDAAVLDPRLCARVVEGLPRTLLHLVALSGPRRTARTTPRVRIAERLVALLDSEAKRLPIRIPALGAQLGVSERTLRRTCREVYDCSPHELLLARRLVEVRRLLLRAAPAKRRVSELAGRCGFWHMGQFAADYRRHFDELPSHTLHTGHGVSMP